MSVIEDPAPTAEDAEGQAEDADELIEDAEEQAEDADELIEDAEEQAEDADEQAEDADELIEDAEEPTPARTVLALGEDPDPPPGATRRMIIAFAITFLVVAAVVALTVSGASREHRVPGVSSRSAPTTSVEHGFTLPRVGRKF